MVFFNLASTISESQVEYIKVLLETWNVNHKSKFGFQDEGIKKVGLGNLELRSFAKLARDPREFLTNELGFDQSELFITNQIRSEPMKHDFYFLRFAI